MAEINRVYTGSPLGLIPDFLGSQNSETSKNVYTTQASAVDSIFSSKHKILKRETSDLFSDPLSFGEASVIHEDKVYDVSTSNILTVLNGYPRMKLKSSDFIYAQDYGVYPNNRLIVCRRFPGPCGDDLTRGGAPPSTTILSWFSDDESPITFDFGENWEASKDTLKDILTDFGKDIGTKISETVGGFGMAIPLPGITEVLQRQILKKLGIIGEGASRLPSGDPNLIMESSQRKLVTMENPGSGLTGKIKVKVNCKWEQKFIAGIDPTFVYYDILRTILSFGGSNATFYLGASKVAAGVGKFLDRLATDPFGLIGDFIKDISGTLVKFIQKLQAFFVKGDAVTDEKIPIGGAAVAADLGKLISGGADLLSEGFKAILKNITYKYKIRIMAVMNYLTGSPSGPWHITIGNPMRPILSSGDMITSSVNVKFGPTLAFNDLPSTIECEFTLESARNLGIGEIFGKFSCGKVRVTRQNPNAKNPIEGLEDDAGNQALEPDTIDVISSLDDRTFYNADGETRVLQDYEMGEQDVLAESLQQKAVSGAVGDQGGDVGGTQSGTGAAEQNQESEQKNSTTDEKDGESSDKRGDWITGELIQSGEYDNNSPIGLTKLIISWKVEKGSVVGNYSGSWKAYKGGVMIDSDESSYNNLEYALSKTRGDAEYIFESEK